MTVVGSFNRRGVVLAEVAAAAAVVLAAVALLAVLSQRTRQSAGLNQSIANLRQISAWSGSYAADNQDRFFAYSWIANQVTPSTYADLRGPFSPHFVAHGAQAIDIMRRRTPAPFLYFPGAWAPNRLYSHLVLAEYAAVPLPSTAFLSPADPVIRWARDLDGYRLSRYMPQPLGHEPGNERWPYTSSYEYPSFFYHTDDGLRGTQTYLSQGYSHSDFWIQRTSGPPMRGRVASDVSFPSHKVQLAESAQRYFGRQDVYHLFAEARTPKLFVDGSISVRAAGDANPGFDVSNPSRNQPDLFTYEPAIWEPPLIDHPWPTLRGYYRWTRAGLQGRDYDGPETDTSEWR